MDFGLKDNLDLLVVDGVYGLQENGETTMLQAFFTDARVNDLRGFWIEIQLGEIWQFEQKRLTTEAANDLNETAREVAKDLVDSGLYDRIETETFIENGGLVLSIKAFDKKDIVVNRKFVI